jgi:uncharacterized protein YjiS (DUF1127 family)
MKTNTVNTAGLPLFEQTSIMSKINVEAALANASVLRSQAFADMFNAIGKAVKSYFRTARTARSLDMLSDAMLADIGIERAQIPSISRALANGTYVSATPAAPLTVTVPAQADAQTHDEHQTELPLAA